MFRKESMVFGIIFLSILVLEVHSWHPILTRSPFTAILMSQQSMSHYPLENDLILRAARGEKVERTPIWVFRQAGRHLPEYNAYKKEKKKNFLQLLQDPVDVAECTMQPIRRYNLDAAILFSDILVILQAMEIEVTMPGGLGILVPHPILSPEDMKQRIPTSVDVKEKLSHVIAAVTLIKDELKGKVPLIGFSAAPWTLIFYLVGGSSKKNQGVASTWLKEHPQESKQLFDLLTQIVIDYLSAQVDAGADMLQIFEAMGSYISEEDFNKWALPSLTTIVQELKKKHPTVPLMVFPRGAPYAVLNLQHAGYDVVSVDTSVDRAATREMLQIAAMKDSKTPAGRHGAATIQGNFNVEYLMAETSSPVIVKREVEKMLREFGPQKLIANLGEGLGGKEDPILVDAFINAVHDVSERLIKEP